MGVIPEEKDKMIAQLDAIFIRYGKRVCVRPVNPCLPVKIFCFQTAEAIPPWQGNLEKFRHGFSFF